MTPPWFNPKHVDQNKTTAHKKAVAYYRHSAQDRQENSIELQQEQVRKFAVEHSIEIIKEFADRGKSGLDVESRDAFNEMLHDYVEDSKARFDYVLVLDVSRWGRFQDTDRSAYYSGLCANHGRQVIFTTIGITRPDDLLHGLHMGIERYRAASYSRELSEKCWRGSAKIASTGYWVGGIPPYAFDRLLLDEKRNPICILKPGERKAIHNQRVVLTLGKKEEVATVRRIYDLFVQEKLNPTQIADALNNAGVPAPRGSRWPSTTVSSILRDEIYSGVMLWNRTSRKLKNPPRHNPSCDWIRSEGAFAPMVSRQVFDRAREIFEKKRESTTDASVVQSIRRLFERYGKISRRLIDASEDVTACSTLMHRFISLGRAYQAMFREIIEERKSGVLQLLKQNGLKVEPCGDLLLIENYFTIALQPSVPVPEGSDVFWLFYPDQCSDITIGIVLSSPDACDVLGFLAFPRILFKNTIKIHSRRYLGAATLHSYELLTFVRRLLE